MLRVIQIQFLPGQILFKFGAKFIFTLQSFFELQDFDFRSFLSEDNYSVPTSKLWAAQRDTIIISCCAREEEEEAELHTERHPPPPPPPPSSVWSVR